MSKCNDELYNNPYLCYIVGTCEMGSEGFSSCMYPMIAYGNNDDEIVESYRENLIHVFGEDVIGKITYGKDGGMFSYYPIHKVKIPLNVYGDARSISVLLNFRKHRDDTNKREFVISEDIASIIKTGSQMMKEDKDGTD